MFIDLKISDHFYATVTLETVPFNQLIQLASLLGDSAAINAKKTEQELSPRPVVYCSEDGQFEVINYRQILEAYGHCQFHPADKIVVSRLTNQDDLLATRMLFQVIHPARHFEEIDPLIRAAFEHNQDTTLLNVIFLNQAPREPITTKKLVYLCQKAVSKSTINARKSELGYANPARGCKATEFKMDTGHNQGSVEVRPC